MGTFSKYPSFNSIANAMVNIFLVIICIPVTVTIRFQRVPNPFPQPVGLNPQPWPRTLASTMKVTLGTFIVLARVQVESDALA